jgi:hypothetical protein
MKAYSDNEDLALLSGIDPKKIVMITLDYSRNFSNYWRSFVWFR